MEGVVSYKTCFTPFQESLNEAREEKSKEETKNQQLTFQLNTMREEVATISGVKRALEKTTRERLTSMSKQVNLHFHRGVRKLHPE